MTDIKRLRERLDRRLRDYEHACRTVKDLKKNLSQSKQELTHAQEAHSLVEQMSREVQQQVHLQIASVVSRCLQIFEEPYTFKISFEKKRNQTEARLLFVRDDLEVDPLTAAGGGVVDVASFALRLACLLLSSPHRRRVVVLDEPFKFTSREYHPALRDLLERLSEELGIQFIVITHIENLQTGKVVVLDSPD